MRRNCFNYIDGRGLKPPSHCPSNSEVPWIAALPQNWVFGILTYTQNRNPRVSLSWAVVVSRDLVLSFIFFPFKEYLRLSLACSSPALWQWHECSHILGHRVWGVRHAAHAGMWAELTQGPMAWLSAITPRWALTDPTSVLRASLNAEFR